MPDTDTQDTPSRIKAAFHTVLLLDASSSVMRLKSEILAAANEMLDEIRKDGGVVSIRYFNRDIGDLGWRMPAASVPRLSDFNYPTDAGTSLFDVISQTLDELIGENASNRGELNGNGEVRVVIFSDGVDTASRKATLMKARLAIGAARERRWEILFVSNVPGLAADLGLDRSATVGIDSRPGNIRAGFRQATIMLHRPDAPKAGGEGVASGPALAAPPSPPPAPKPPEPPRKKWWRFGW